MKTGYLGPEGSYSNIAAKKLCGEDGLCAYPSFRALFSALAEKELSSIVVPVENTVNGAVAQCLDLLEEFEGVFAVQRCGVDLDHRLATLKGAKLSDIRKVFSHPQALAQCSKFLAEKLPDARLYEISSTSESLKMITDIGCAGIVGSHMSAEGIVLSEDCISNERTSYTSFLKVINGDESFALPQSDRVFFTFICRHEAGALCKILSVLAGYNLNMTKIESRPIKNKLNEFRFFVEIEGGYDGALPALNSIREMSLSFKLLGVY